MICVLEMYRSGRTGTHSKCVCRAIGTRVRISPSPPHKNQRLFVAFLFGRDGERRVQTHDQHCFCNVHSNGSRWSFGMPQHSAHRQICLRQIDESLFLFTFIFRHTKTSDFLSLSTNKKTSDTFERHPICRQFFLKSYLIIYFQNSIFYRILIDIIFFKASCFCQNFACISFGNSHRKQNFQIFVDGIFV